MEMRLKNMVGGFGAAVRCCGKPGIDSWRFAKIGTEAILQ
jgi:hypothetical protein